MNIDQQRVAFEAWIKTHCDYDDLDRSEMLLARDAWQAAVKWASETEEGTEALGFLKGLESGTRAALASPEVQALRKDADRYRWLKEKMLGIDFDWQEAGITALSFEMPAGCAYGGDCDQNIDAAMEKQK